MTIMVEWLDDWDGVSAAAGTALDRAHQPGPFDRLDWYRLVHTHLFAGTTPAVLHAYDERGAAWLLLTIGGRTAAPLAGWYSFAWGPVFAGEGDRDALLEALLRKARERCDRLQLRPLDGTRAALLDRALRRTGWQPFRDRISTNWTIEIGGDVIGRRFADYWRDRPSRLRNTVERQARSHPLRITLHRRFDAAAWRAYEEIYAASWKPAEGSTAFLRALAEREGAAGTLRLGLAEDASGRPVAAQFWLVENGVATIHKLAHREDAKAHSPGSILSRAMFEAAIDEDHVGRIDFGLGDEPYKADWMDTADPVFCISAYKRTSLSALFGIAREEAARLVRRARGG